MIYDCFFSYQHEDLPFVEAVVGELEKRGLTCWYAPRNITGRYAKAIADGISHSKVFVLVVNPRSAVSEPVLNEIEIAHNVNKTTGYAIMQPLCTEPLDFDAMDFQEMLYYIRRFQFLYTEGSTAYESIADSIIKSQPTLQARSQERKTSTYVVQSIEDRRLEIQNSLLRDFDGDVYRKVFGQYEAPRVLDVGCGTGDMLVPLAKELGASLFLGIDRSQRQVETATEKHGAENYRFLQKDVTEADLDACLSSAMAAMGAERFDIINISMLLLHLKEPTMLLAALRKYLQPQGTVIIRDIDDGLNFAYPDPDKRFERIYKICDHDEQSGNRRNGRQIHHALVQAGYSRVQLLRQGLSSANMNPEQKEALFRMYFPFTLENAGIMAEKYAWNLEYREDYQWYSSVFEDVHALFSTPDFIFSLGFMSYIAKP